MKEKNILFLDFDGVLNNYGLFVTRDKSKSEDLFDRDIDRSNLRVLNYILDNTPGMEIIVSSTWGMYFNIEEIKEGLVRVGMKPEHANRFIGVTPKKMSSNRCHEVLWAVEDLEEEGYKVGKWLTLDDHSIFPDSEPFSQYQEREVTTNQVTGLTVTDAWKIIRYFNLNFKRPTMFL